MPREKSRLSIVLAGGAVLASQAAVACPSPPSPVRDLALDRYYGDKAGTIVDPARKAAHGEAARPLVDFVRVVTELADRAGARRDAGAAACAAERLEAWARGGALLGDISGPQAQAQRKWDFAGLALAYIKFKPLLAAEPRAAIEPWLTRLADAVHADAASSGKKRNNHWYWTGLAMGATGLASGNSRYWEIARGIMRDAASDIRPDGTLPLELERGARALHYHAFSVTALVALAELGASRGEDWYGVGDGALHRLVAVTSRGLGDPATFDRLAGIAQERPVNPGSGWHTLYEARFPGRLGHGLPAIGSKHRWLGGDVRVLTERLARPHGASD